MKFKSLDNKTFENTDKSFADVEVGDKEQQEFYPQIKIKRWDNECNLSVRLIKDISSSSHKVKGDKIIWTASDNTEAQFYSLPADNWAEYGYNEFEVVLKEKPESNLLLFSIKTKGLDFFYQTDQTTVSGVYQPENCIGSYAVYHSTKKDHIMGQTNYRCGKAFHIYRPHVEDANNVVVWCGLGIDVKKGTLTITIPQDFIDNAVYPIIVDPTFGNTHTGSDYVWWRGVDTNGNDLAKGTTGGTGGEVIKISTYCSVDSNSVNVKAAIWSYSAKTLITNGVSNSIAVSNQYSDWEWNDFTFTTNPTVSGSTDYYIGTIFDQVDSGHYYCTRYDISDANTGGWSYNNYTTPTSLGSISNDTEFGSVYATYAGDTALTSDNFNDNSLNTDIWGSWTNSSGTVNEQNQRIEFTGTDNNDDAYIYQTNISGDFDVSIKVVDVSTNCNAGISMDVQNWLVDCWITDGDLYGQIDGNGSQSVTIPNYPFWMRIKREGTTGYVYYTTTFGGEWILLNSGAVANTAHSIFVYFFGKTGNHHAYFDDFVNLSITVSESMSITDSLSVAGGRRDNTVVESINISDALSVSGGRRDNSIIENISITDSLLVTGGRRDVTVSESINITDNLKVVGGTRDITVIENISIIDVTSAKEYGLVVFDTAGDTTLKLTDTITRLIFTTIVSGGDSDSATTPSCNNPVGFSVALDADKISHGVSVGTNSVSWTARSTTAVGEGVTFGWESGDSLIYVVSYD